MFVFDSRVDFFESIFRPNSQRNVMITEQYCSLTMVAISSRRRRSFVHMINNNNVKVNELLKKKKKNQNRLYKDKSL